MKVKYTVKEVREDGQLNLDQIMYTKKIVPFMIKVTKENILDLLNGSNLLTEEIRNLIEDY